MHHYFLNPKSHGRRAVVHTARCGCCVRTRRLIDLGWHDSFTEAVNRAKQLGYAGKDASIVAYTKDSKLKGFSRENAPTRPNCPTSSCKAEVGQAHLSSGLVQST